MTDKPYEPDSTAALDVLAASALFGRLDRGARAAIADDLEVIDLVAGGVLFRQGEPGDGMYIVDRGMLEVRVTDSEGRTRVLDRLDAGSTVGEMALLTGQPRTGDVVALVDSRLVRFSKVGYERLAAQYPAIASGFSLAVAPRIRRLQLAGVLYRLFGELDAATLHTLQDQLEWRRVPDGEALFHQGETGDTMYIVINGRFQVVTIAEDGRETVRGEIGEGETAGEYALLSDDKRSATLYATRDTDVVAITRPVFESLARQYPQIVVAISRIIVNRQLRQLRPERAASTGTLTLALFPAGEDVAPLEVFATALEEQLAVFGETALYTSESFDSAYGLPGASQTEPDDPLSLVINHWLQEQENRYSHIIYVADGAWTTWTQRCLSQADRVILVAPAGGNPRPGRLELACNPRTRQELVLLHPAATEIPANTHAWLEPRAVSAYYHVRQGDKAHWERLARCLTGRGVGAVLSGGSARALAHIGVVRALDEAGQPVDYIGGTSMGAFVGGGWALGLTPADGMVLAARMANPDYLLDRTLPYTAIMSSAKVTRVMQEIYGETQIEDLWRPFFCIATNLSNASPVVMDRGPLWRAIRASTAIPGVFSPVLNEYSELLVDGGVMNNFPLDVMAARHDCGLIIGSNTSPQRERPFPYQFGDSVSGWRVLWSRLNPFGRSEPVPSMVDILTRSMDVNSLYLRSRILPLANILIEPDVKDFDFLDFADYEELERRGYEAGRKAMAAHTA